MSTHGAVEGPGPIAGPLIGEHPDDPGDPLDSEERPGLGEGPPRGAALSPSWASV